MYRVVSSLSAVFLISIATLANAQKPALTQNVDEKGRVPFQHKVVHDCPLGATNSCAIEVQVPSGQRLVVTHVSAMLYTAVGSGEVPDAVYALITVGPSLPSAGISTPDTVDFQIPFTVLGRNGVGLRNTYVLDREITCFAQGGSTVKVTAQTASGTVFPQNLSLTVTGYLIPVAN